MKTLCSPLFIMISLARVKNFLFKDSANTDSDALLSSLIVDVMAEISNATHCKLEVTTIQNEKHRADALWATQSIIKPYFRPVADVTSITFIGLTGSDTVTAEDDAFIFDASNIYYTGSGVLISPLQIVINYKAGFDVIPADLESLAIELIGLRYNASGKGGSLLGVVSQSDSANVSASTSYTDLTAKIERICSQYRPIAV